MQISAIREFLTLLILAVLYLAIKSVLAPSAPLPDVPLLIVFYMGFKKTSVEGALMGFGLGYIEDTINGGIFGVTSFALVVIFLAVYLGTKKVHFSTPATKAGAAALLTLLKGALVYAVLSFTSFEVPFLWGIILGAIITGAFAPAAIHAFSWILALVSPKAF